MPVKAQPPATVPVGPDPMPGLLQRRADAERSLSHVLLAGGDTAGVRGVLAATDAAIVTAKADRARVEANTRRDREQRIRAVANNLVAEAAAEMETVVRPLRTRPAPDLSATRA